MALPTSTLVMALITAVPFGLAIKDTLAVKSPMQIPDDDEEAHEESYLKAQREFEELEAKREAEIDQAIGSLIPPGSSPGVLGLGGYEINQRAPASTEAKLRIERSLEATFAPNRKPDGTLKRLTISLPDYRGSVAVCRKLRNRLEEEWGSASRSYGDGNTHLHFIAATPRQRVTYVELSANCDLVLEEYVPASEFVTKLETSTVPLWAVGQPAAKLVEKLGEDAFSDDSQIRWTRPGVGDGPGETELYARIVKGKIVTITATFQATSATIGKLTEALTADHGEPVDAYAEPIVWKKSKLSLETQNDSDYTLVAGAPLPIGAGE